MKGGNKANSNVTAQNHHRQGPSGTFLEESQGSIILLKMEKQARELVGFLRDTSYLKKSRKGEEEGRRRKKEKEEKEKMEKKKEKEKGERRFLCSLNCSQKRPE